MSKRPSPQDVLNALRTVEDPVTRRDIVSLGYVKDVEVASEYISFTIQFRAQPVPEQTQLGVAARKAVEALGIADVRVQMTMPPPPDRGSALIPNVKHTIAVASGKGGVGKSTVAANLAVALHRQKMRVGLMDTDVYGPSIPALLGGKEPPQVVEGKLEPATEFGVKIVSMAYFLPPDEAVVWRGPMLHKTIQQFLGDVRWGELDYLIMDLPPGTGDIQLSLSQTIPLTGAVIVSTPQDLALSVAWKAIAMFKKMQVPILGIIENMSYYVCPHCGHREDIFGHGGARRAAQKIGYPFLGEIPLDPSIRKRSDSGKPVALGEDDESKAHAAAYLSIAGALCEQVEKTSATSGPVVIE